MKRILFIQKVKAYLTKRLGVYELEAETLYTQREKAIHPARVKLLNEQLTALLEKSSDLRRILGDDVMLQQFIDRYNKLQNDLVKLQNEAEDTAGDLLNYIMKKDGKLL